MRAMTSSRITRSLAGALALTLGLATAAAAQPPGRRGARSAGPANGDGRPGPGARMMGPLGGLLALHPDLPLPGLNLTDAQREQVRAIMQHHRDDGRALLQKAQAAFDALQKSTATTVDEGAAAQHGQALGAVIGEAAVLRARVRGEIFAILTPEQQAEANRILAERRERRDRLRRQPPRATRPPRQQFEPR